MITATKESELGSYSQQFNHGHKVCKIYQCISAYKEPEGHWLNCPCCGLKPKVWVFDNGRQTACGCGNNEYDHFSVHAESIMSVHQRTNGKEMSKYDSDLLRKNWNEYCSTMINPCSFYDLKQMDRW